MEIKNVILDGQAIWKLKCPDCGMWGHIDKDQFEGRVSVDCPECSFHETINFKEKLDE